MSSTLFLIYYSNKNELTKKKWKFQTSRPKFVFLVEKREACKKGGHTHFTELKMMKKHPMFKNVKITQNKLSEQKKKKILELCNLCAFVYVQKTVKK